MLCIYIDTWWLNGRYLHVLQANSSQTDGLRDLLLSSSFLTIWCFLLLVIQMLVIFIQTGSLSDTSEMNKNRPLVYKSTVINGQSISGCQCWPQGKILTNPLVPKPDHTHESSWDPTNMQSPGTPHRRSGSPTSAGWANQGLKEIMPKEFNSKGGGDSLAIKGCCENWQNVRSDQTNLMKFSDFFVDQKSSIFSMRKLHVSYEIGLRSPVWKRRHLDMPPGRITSRINGNWGQIGGCMFPRSSMNHHVSFWKVALDGLAIRKIEDTSFEIWESGQLGYQVTQQ